ncbi:hypothetical protein LEN26_001378 [Aphanomyces euteiches]|nr:hypothetical protein AeMF1_010489 [Aphanomyces euteiches]KAH9161495.1 hypothetical protein LEN26_001378 [Aphanomyces euteiches]KAH9187935.1 hypothetical protein AeNC1_010091 [Aphanomyces euteiches]
MRYTPTTTTASSTSRYQSLAADPQVRDDTHHHPIERASFVSKLLYTWATPLLELGNERQLHPDDVWPLEHDNQCKNVSRIFEPKFNKSRSILTAIAATYGWRFAFVGVLQLGSVAATLYGPVVLRQMLTAMEHNTFDVQDIMMHIMTLLVVKLVQAVITAHANLDNQVLAVRITSALQHLLFQKALTLDAKCRRDKTAGEIANMFSNDIQWIINFAVFANQLWLIPVQVVVTTTMLYGVIGWATFVGFGVIVLTLVGNNHLAAIQHKAFKQLMDHKDTRMKTIHEVFGAMQIVKLNAWEDQFHDKITTERARELKTLWRIFTLASMSTAVLYLGPVLVTIVTFATYTLLMQQPLSATKVFTALTLFNLLKFPLSGLPTIIASMMQALVALRRFMEFLDLAEKDPSCVLTPATAPPQVVAKYSSAGIDVAVERASFGWDNGKLLFEDLNFKIRRGEFVVVHGSVGEGKSSLCAALLGEMDKFAGTVFVGGQIAYFSQQSWIQNMSIRDNILFGKPYERSKYHRVLEACALVKDLALFPAGDRTEIGQKGVNISGGQKARVCLARACYSDADIFILDAPLSAVDAIVQNEIFTKCFLGLLKNKTILLVTHCPEIIHSNLVDRVVEIKAGRLAERVIDVKEVHEPSPSSKIVPFPMRHLYSADDDEFAPGPAHGYTNELDGLLSPSLMSPFPQTFEAAVTPFEDYHVQKYDEKSPRTGRLIMDEERCHGRVATQVFKDYMAAAGGWSVFLYWVFLLTIWQCLMVASDFWLSAWSSTAAVVPPAVFLSQANYYLSVYTVMSLGCVILTMFRTLSIYTAGIRASRLLFDQMTQALLRAPMRFFDTNPLGRILNRYSNDINTVDTTIPFGVSGLISAIFATFFVVATTFYVIGAMAVFVVPLLYVYSVFGRFYVQPAREIERVNKTTKSPLLTLISESIEGALVIRAFGSKQLRRFQRMHYRNVDTNNEAAFAAQVITQWFQLRMQLTSAAILFVVATSLVVLRDRLTAGLIGLVLNYLFTILGYFEYMVGMWSQMETAMVGPERISEYSHITQEAPRVISGAVSKEWPTKGDIEFESMSFRYKENDPLVLKDVNVHIQAGEKIGIVGRTGAGKSSLTMALFRINELACGRIKIDGMDIAKVGVKTLRRAIAIIPQTPVLFKGTLRNYLDPFGEFTDKELWSCLRKVELVDRIANVGDQLDSPVDENGENFSVGERQMLCMARALLRQARIVVMDEATAAIDHETDQNLQRVIRKEFSSSTVLTIAHRLDTVLDCNRILVFDQGRLVQCNTPKALIDQGDGIFFELCSEGGYLDKIMSK